LDLGHERGLNPTLAKQSKLSESSRPKQAKETATATAPATGTATTDATRGKGDMGHD
jgi:hypothetical protein